MKNRLKLQLLKELYQVAKDKKSAISDKNYPKAFTERAKETDIKRGLNIKNEDLYYNNVDNISEEIKKLNIIVYMDI